jgi:peptidoglycan/LPS O-acetylase OafA/YrhL
MPDCPQGKVHGPRCPRYQTLDAWRGLACLLVVFYHSTLICHDTRPDAGSGLGSYLISFAHVCNAGVPMFFVISGYCISAAADSARRRQHSVRSYFWRRFRRIFPPLWIMIAAGVALFLVLDYLLCPGILSSPPWPQLRPWWYSGWQWLGNFTLTESWRHYLIGSPRGHFPGQAWTLCYEEQFYALTGLLLLVAARRFFSAALVLTAAVMGVMALGHWHGVSFEGFFFDGSWLTFAAGMLVYYRTNYAGPVAGWLLNCVLAAASLLALRGLVPVPGGEVAFPFALLLSLVHRFDLHTARARLLVPLALCGQMCYSLYLVHQLPTKAISNALHRSGVTSDAGTLLLTVPACIAASVLVGWVFYLAVERRFLNSLPAGPAPAGREALPEDGSRHAAGADALLPTAPSSVTADVIVGSALPSAP